LHFARGGEVLTWLFVENRQPLATLPTMKEVLRAIDIGATSIKGTLFGADESLVRARRTHPPVNPQSVVALVCELCEALGEASSTVVGFPGPVVDGVVRSATNLDPEGKLDWEGFDFVAALRAVLNGNVLLANDADLAALGAAEGKGLELTVTLGTGVGTGITRDGVLQPHRELCELSIGTADSLDDYIGEPARKLLSDREWDYRVVEVLELLASEVGPDQIWLAGGNARRLTRSLLGTLKEKVWVLSEPVGLLGACRYLSC
jgi:polyphosphate glucokinase